MSRRPRRNYTPVFGSTRASEPKTAGTRTRKPDRSPRHRLSGRILAFTLERLFVEERRRLKIIPNAPVPLGHRRNLIAIRLADDCNHLLFRKPTFAHCSLRIGSQSLT